MTLDQLSYFQAVCKYNGISRAAEALNISQPSVSNAIAKLEKEFGIELFHRKNKQLFLTSEGLLMAEMAEKLLSQADDINQTMQALGKKSKILRLGIPPMIGSLVLPLLYNEHFPLHPQLQVRIIEGDSSALRQLLADNQVDMAFLPHTRPFDSTLESQQLAVLENVCCVHKNHRLAALPAIRLKDLTKEPMVLFKNSFFQTERILEEFSRLSCTPNVLFDTAQLSTVQNMVASGTAIGFMFAFLLKTTPELVGIPLDPPMTTQVSLVWKKGNQITSDMRKLIEFIESKKIPG